MKRIIIICEGETEQAFCKDVLSPHFFNQNIIIEYPTIKKSGGGMVSWAALQKQIENHLIQDTQAIVSTLIDFYGILDTHKFPKWEEAKRILNKSERLSFLETAMQAALHDAIAYRFTPYLQLHEFEGLLFSNMAVFEMLFDKKEFKNYDLLKKTIAEFPNPEDINEGATTAPSKRLTQILDRYDKTLYGSILAEAIGLNQIREKCPRFNNWLNVLVEKSAQ
jgi:hypothetical protein